MSQSPSGRDEGRPERVKLGAREFEIERLGLILNSSQGRLSALERRAIQRGRRLRDSAGLVQITVTVQDDIAPGGQSRFRARSEGAPERLHGKVVTEQQAAEAERSPDHGADHLGRSRRRRIGIERRIDDMGRHGGGRSLSARKGENRAPRVRRGWRRPREFEVAVCARAAMPRNMLEYGKNPTREQPFGDSSAQGCDPRRISAVSPGADHRVCLGIGDVEHGAQSDIDANLAQIVRHKLGRQSCGFDRGLGASSASIRAAAG